jgi:hypothetical protein
MHNSNDNNSLIRHAAATALSKFTDTWWTPLHSCPARQFVHLLMHNLHCGLIGRIPVKWNKDGDEEENNRTTERILKWFYDWGAHYLIHRGATFLARHGSSQAAQFTSLSNSLELCYRHFYAASGGMRAFYECYTKCLSASRPNSEMAKECAAITAVANAPYAEFSWSCEALLQIVPSEAAVERTFSAQGMLMTKRRNRLADSTVINELTLKFNHIAMQVDKQPRKFDSLACVHTLSDDDFVVSE